MRTRTFALLSLAMLGSALLAGCSFASDTYSSKVEGYANRVHVIMDPLLAKGGIPKDVDLAASMAKLADLAAEALVDLGDEEVTAQHQASHAHMLSAMDNYLSGAIAAKTGLQFEAVTRLQAGAQLLEQGNADMNAWLEDYNSE